MDEEAEFIPDYEPDEDELPTQRIRGSVTKRFGKGKQCHICTGRFTNVRRHVTRFHLPWYMAPTTACWECKMQYGQMCLLNGHIKEDHNGEEVGRKFDRNMHLLWVELVNGFLEAIQKGMECSSLDGLCEIANGSIHFERYSEPTLQDADLASMALFNELNGFQTQNSVQNLKSSLQKPLKVHSLLHWKIMSLLLVKTGNIENLSHFEQKKPFRTVVHKEREEKNEKNDITLVDSHFHMDIYLKRIQSVSRSLPMFQWNWSGTNYKIQHLVTNCCFPRNWPSSTERSKIRKDERISMTFGIHPRMVTIEKHEMLDKWINDMKNIVHATKCVAVGECGLDNSDGNTDVNKQLKYLEKQLEIAKEVKLPVVIHCRGDTRTEENCLNCLTNILPKTHKIHRHCFNGDDSSYSKWKSAFPNCKFGISPFLIMNEKYPDLRAVVCSMKLEDIILETDAPYIHQPSESFGSPMLIQDILSALYSMFPAYSTDEIANITTKNCLQLYNIS